MCSEETGFYWRGEGVCGEGSNQVRKGIMELEGRLGKSGGKQRGRKVEIRGSEMVGRRRKEGGRKGGKWRNEGAREKGQ